MNRRTASVIAALRFPKAAEAALRVVACLAMCMAAPAAAGAQGLLTAGEAIQQGGRFTPPQPIIEPRRTNEPAPAQAPAQLEAARQEPARQAPAAAAPSPILQKPRVVFGSPPGGVTSPRIRSFLPRASAEEGRAVPNVKTTDSGGSAERLRAQGGYLRRMPVNLHGYRLRGEIDATEWPVYVTDAEARARLQFRVSYLTAISVMPEASVLTLIINDVVVGQTNLQAPSGARQALFDIPADLMRPGWNSVRITADMRHRVDCSLGATYELWTQLDPANTGLEVTGAPARVGDAADVAAVGPDVYGALPVRAVIPGRTTLETMDQVMKAVQGVAVRGRFLQPVVDVGSAAEGDAGLNLLIGAYRDISRQPGIETMGAVTGPRVALLPGAGTRRPTLVVTGQTDADLAQALASFAAPPEPRGTPSGLLALKNYRGLRVEEAGRISLRSLNIPSIEFNGRLFRVAFDLVLPPDFYTSDYAKVILRLDGGYVAGLGPEPQISISVNGRDAATTVLASRDGEVFRRNEIPFPLGRLKPGFNRVEILARVPSPSDRACDPVAAIGAPKRFLLLDTSEIVIPTLARVAEMPNLAVTTSDAFPMSLTGRSRLFLPTPDRHSVGAAATVAAQMALAAERVIDIETMVAPPADNTQSTIVVAPVSALSDATLEAVGVNPASLKGVWANRQTPAPRVAPALESFNQLSRQRAMLTRNLPGYCTMARLGDAAQPAPAAQAEADPKSQVDTTELPDRDVLAKWNETIYGRTSLLAQVSGLVSNITSVGVGMVSGARSLFQDAETRAGTLTSIPPATSLVMAQEVLPGRHGTVLTVVTAPNSQDLQEATACLIDPTVWAEARGQKALLDAASGEVTTIAPTTTQFIPTTVFSLVNARLVAASWLSHNPSVYVVSSLLVAIFLGGTTTWLLRNIGRKQ